ncbi:hypothetical protein Tcan_06837 [Toxocara canis]|uniref:Protection of telomeres protein 1 ssDNA-binding domain-containing protein n=1 Tax=Toxocara canis TaxID=6265 RepID=A0A0B2VEZ2_TOXCA|nr:hypothetical protein Tcan_06837 [Toxocara canis]
MATRTSPKKSPKENSSTYHYTQLAQLSNPQDIGHVSGLEKVNVFAIIENVTTRTKADPWGNEQLTSELMLVDESSIVPTKCMIYSEMGSDFSHHLQPGSIIRIHRVTVDALRSLLRNPHRLETEQSNDNFQKENPAQDLLGNFPKFRNFARYGYHDIVVQVMGTPFWFDGDCVSRVVDSNDHLYETVESMSYDIIMYGEHGDNVLANVKAGDVLLLRNVHYYINALGSSLVMHDGQSSKRFNRGFEVLDDQSPIKIAFLRETENFFAGVSVVASAPAECSSNARASIHVAEEEEDAATATDIENLYSSEPRDDRIRKLGEARHALISSLQLSAIKSALPLLRRRMQTRCVTNTSSYLRETTVTRIRFMLRLVLQHLASVDNGERILRKLLRCPANDVEAILSECLAKCLKLNLATIDERERGCEGSMNRSTQSISISPRKRRANEAIEKSSTTMNWPLMLLKTISSGTTLCVQNWKVDLTFSRLPPIFVLECGECQLWRTANGGNISFLFSLALMEFYTGGLPSSASEAAAVWMHRMQRSEERELSRRIQAKMLKPYTFTMEEIKIRRCDERAAIFEVIVGGKTHTYIDCVAWVDLFFPGVQ